MQSQSNDADQDPKSPFATADDMSLSRRLNTDLNRQHSLLQRLVIKKESSWKNIFDLVILVLAAYTITVNAYYAAFGTPTDVKQILVDYIVEVFFLLDIFFSFCQEYVDQETYAVESNFHAIALNYMKTRLAFDLLAVIPLDLLLRDHFGENAKLLRLLKWLRMPRLAKILDQARFKLMISRFFEAQMEAKYRKFQDNISFPIERKLVLVNIYRICTLVLIMLASSYFVGILWYIYIDYKDSEDSDFASSFELNQVPNSEK